MRRTSTVAPPVTNLATAMAEQAERAAELLKALSQHLAKLREEGLVETRKAAQTVYYRLAEGPAMAVIRTLHDVYCPGDQARICT